MRNPRTVLLLLLLAGLPVAGNGPGWSITPRPDWVTPVGWDVPTGLPAEVPSGGIDYVLFDYQVDRRSGHAAYAHTVIHLVDAAGVQAGSELDITFDSLYQRAEVHAVTLYRDGQVVDRLASASLDLDRRESTRDEEIYHATRSLRAYPEDVRVGDVLEFEYTIVGANPVFGDSYSDSISLGWSVPVGHAYRSVLWPAGRPLRFRVHGTDQEPEIRQEGEALRYVWELVDVPAVLPDGDLPEGFDPYPWIQLSTFEDWSDVVDWGRSLFRLPGRAPPEMLDLVRERVGADAGPKAVAREALRVVQDEIRYLYIGLAESSHRPSSPARVVERRFGDCKDKSLLLTSILHDFGLDATPALVSTVDGPSLGEKLPSPLVFDHAIVRVRIDGGIYWLDATDSHQGGNLDQLAPPLYHHALVLEEGSRDLEPIPVPRLDEPTISVVARFDLGDGSDSVDLVVETIYLGADADSTRYHLRTTSLPEVQQSYQSFYGRLYPSIEPTAPVEWEDDQEANRLVVREQYRVPGFWEPDSASGSVAGELYPLELAPYFDLPSTAARTMPLDVTHPVHLLYDIEARFGKGWSIVPESDTVDSAAFSFDREVEADGDMLRVSYRYRSKADRVPPEFAAEYFDAVSDASLLLSYPLTLLNGGSGGPHNINWPIVLLGCLVLALDIALALRVYRWAPPPLALDPQRAASAPEGLGGWLIAPGVSLVFIVFSTILQIVSGADAYSLPVWNAFTTPGSDRFHPLWAPVLIAELAVNITELVAAVLLLVLFFRCRTSFPRILPIFLVVRLVLLVADRAVAGGLASAMPGAVDLENVGAGLTDVWRVALHAVVWTWYMGASARVRKTFRERPGGSDPRTTGVESTT